MLLFAPCGTKILQYREVIGNTTEDNPNALIAREYNYARA